MFEKIRFWYLDNGTEITWFIVGFLIADTLTQIGRGNLIGALVSAGLAGLNYSLRPRP